ncbi:MAG: DUF4127 family protein [Candidatus Bruticola sp.]
MFKKFIFYALSLTILLSPAAFAQLPPTPQTYSAPASIYVPVENNSSPTSMPNHPLKASGFSKNKPNGINDSENWEALYIPLDDRPCNWLFPKQIARIGGGRLITPERCLLGKAYQPGSPQQLKEWLYRQPIYSNAIISADMLAYGGLIASRTAKLSVAEALANLNILPELAQKGQKLEVLAIVPRLSLRTSDEQSPYEAGLRNWAAQGQTKPPANVPEKYFQEYMQVRNRNLEVIYNLLIFTHQGIIDHLVIGQDDSSRTGIHIGEIAQLQAKAQELGITDKVDILCGADELASNMTAGWLARESGYVPHLELDYSDPEYKDKVPPMESFTLAETARLHIKLSRAAETIGTGTVIFIETPSDKPFAQPNLEGNEETKTQAEHLLNRINQKFDGQRKRPYGLADLHLVNRAEPIFAQTLIDNVPIWELACYSAWNTPSNSLGTAIAQACAQQIAIVKGKNWSLSRKLESEKTHQAFTVARLVDDYAYQAVIRQNLTQEYKNIDIRANPMLNLAGPAGLAARNAAIPWAQQLWDEKLLGQSYYSPIVRSKVVFRSMFLEVTLPWPRLFEIEERLNITLDTREVVH